MEWREWIQFVEIPAIAALAVWVQVMKSDLNNFKVKVAEKYVSSEHLSEVEKSIIRQLEHIENRLEGLARQPQYTRQPPPAK